jgi:sugar lactone lactonase YvrE
MKPIHCHFSRAALGLVFCAASAFAAELPKVLARFDDVAVGVATSADGRTFVSFSRAIDPKVTRSVAELKDGKPVEFPPGFKQDNGAAVPERLLSVQALTVDAKNRLWILDSARVGNRTEVGAVKLLAWDLRANKVVKRYTFPVDLAGKTSFYNDVRIDLHRGKEGVAFITDASPEGPNAIVVVDLESGRLTRRLNDHPSVKPDPQLTLKVQGEPLIQKQAPNVGKPFQVGADGLALCPNGKLYYSALSSHRLYRATADALADPFLPDADVEKTVEDLGDKGFASDGLLCDAENRVYATDIENNAVHRLNADGGWEELVQAPDLRWPDSLALMPDGKLLITSTQIDRSSRFREEDERYRPFKLFMIPTDSRPAESVKDVFKGARAAAVPRRGSSGPRE